MHSSKLFKVLAALEEVEWIEFRDHLKSNTQQKSKVLSLYFYIFKRRQVLDSNKLAMSEVRTQISGYRSEKYIRNLMSQLFSHLEEYLILNEFKTQKNDQKLHLFNALNKRGLYHLADNYASKLRSQWSDPKIKDHKNYNRLLQLSHAHYLSNNPIKNSNKVDLLSELFKSYNSYQEVMLKFYSFLLANEKKIIDLSEIESSIDKYGNYFENIADQHILKTITNLKLILTEDRVAFNYLFIELCSETHHYSDELAIIVYEKCRAYITKQVASKNIQYSEKLLAIYDLGIQRGYLLYNGRMSALHFYNIFSTACSLGKVKWASNYLKEYIDLIPIESVSSVKLLSNSELYFVDHSYFNAIEILNQVELGDINLKLKQRFMLLCSFFVIHDSYSFIDAQINNYNQFFYYNRLKISAANFEGSLNLGRIIRQLVTGADEDEIFENISQAKYLAFRLRLPTIIEQRKIYAKKMGLNY